MSSSAQDSVAWAAPDRRSPEEMRVPSLGASAGILALVGMIAAINVATGPQVRVGAFYLVAVLVGTWRGGRALGLWAAATSAMATLFADLLLSEPFDAAWIPYWNAFARALVYSGAVFAGARLQRLMLERDRAARDLERALGELRTLQGLLPICAWCKRIRDEEDRGIWKPIERYVADHSDATFTHGICAECAVRFKEEGGA